MKLKSWFKIILFVSSYFPLLIIFSIKYWGYFNHIFSYAMIGLVVVSCGLTSCMIQQANSISGNAHKIVSVDNQASEALNYLYAYVIPFLSFSLDDKSEIVSICIFISITAIIYIKSNLFYINPFLNLLGYNSLKVNLEDRSIYVISKQDIFNIRKQDIINIIHINGNLYLFDKTVEIKPGE